MSRQRLSWDKTADPYTMNQKRENPPAKKYDTGDSYDFGEQPDMKHPWEGEKRTETGHPAPAREAVKAARKLEDKAIKCITIAQRMLPGASDEVIEEQATDLMYMPEPSVLSTLQRQASLAETLTAGADADADKDKDADKDEDKTAGELPLEEKEKKDDDDKDEDADKTAKGKIPPQFLKKKKKKEEGEEGGAEEGGAEEGGAEEESAEVAEKAEETEKDEDKAAAKKAPAEEKKPADAPAKEKKPADAPAEDPADIMAADADLLDKIFAAEDIIPEKAGAKKLSGIVKKASSADPLDNLWDAPPDVSKVFGK